MLTNSQTTSFVAALNAIGAMDSAQAAFDKRVIALATTGFKAEWLKTTSERIGEVRETVARNVLTAANYKVWSDTSLARKVMNKKTGKRESTPRDNHMKTVDGRISRLRVALEAVGAERGPRKGNRDLNTRIVEEIDTLRNAVKLDREGAAVLKADHKEMLAAFTRITDLLK